MASSSPSEAKGSRRRVLLAVGAVALLLLVAVSVAAALSFIRASARLAPKGAVAADLERELDAEATGPQYVLTLAAYRPPGQERGTVAAVLLLQIEAGSRRATVVSIPAATVVSTASAPANTVGALYEQGGAHVVVRAIKELTGLPVNHYVQLDFEGLARTVDALGGVWMTVDEDVDNAYLGQPAKEVVRVPKGYRRLSGMQVLVYLKDQSEGVSEARQVARQQSFLTAVMQQLGSPSHLTQLPTITESVSQNMMTDMSMTQLLQLARAFRGVPKGDLTRRALPGRSSGRNPNKVFVPDPVKCRALFRSMAPTGSAD